MNPTDDLVRCRYRDSWEHPTMMILGEALAARATRRRVASKTVWSDRRRPAHALLRIVAFR